MPSFFRHKNKGLRVGLCLSEQSVSLVVIMCNGTDLPTIKASFRCDISDRNSLNDAEQQVAQFVESNHLKKVNCYCVLNEKDYQLLLVDPPEVPESELIGAMRWKVKDLVSMDVDNAVIDVFPQPQKKMVYTVVSEKKSIQRIVDFVKKVHLNLVSIDIEELSYRNLFERYPFNERGVAVIVIKKNEGKLLILKQGNLYLSRKFSIDYGGGVFDDLPEDAIILELQRSLDYYERQMGQSTPADIIFCGDIGNEKITSTIKNSFQQKISWMDIKDIAGENVVEVDVADAIALTGSALRQRVA